MDITRTLRYHPKTHVHIQNSSTSCHFHENGRTPKLDAKRVENCWITIINTDKRHINNTVKLIVSLFTCLKRTNVYVAFFLIAWHSAGILIYCLSTQNTISLFLHILILLWMVVFFFSLLVFCWFFFFGFNVFSFGLWSLLLCQLKMEFSTFAPCVFVCTAAGVSFAKKCEIFRILQCENFLNLVAVVSPNVKICELKILVDLLSLVLNRIAFAMSVSSPTSQHPSHT